MTGTPIIYRKKLKSSKDKKSNDKGSHSSRLMKKKIRTKWTKRTISGRKRPTKAKKT